MAVPRWFRAPPVSTIRLLEFGTLSKTQTHGTDGFRYRVARDVCMVTVTVSKERRDYVVNKEAPNY